ncbi:MAG: 2-phosphosulfolactate phosphatase, partial [Actinobacteria bacterium]|nr:2-phosphosulfolactate phosphatase [Actinomycetota bacterium]
AAVSDQVMLGCLLNLSAVLTALRGREDWTRLDLQLICSGTDGAPALEDAYVAGLISAVLPGPRSDAALICEAVARAYPTPVEALAASADAAILRGARLEADIAHCATVSRLDCVPTVVGTQVGVAIVAAGADGLAPALGASDRGTVSA